MKISFDYMKLLNKLIEDNYNIRIIRIIKKRVIWRMRIEKKIEKKKRKEKRSLVHEK